MVKMEATSMPMLLNQIFAQNDVNIESRKDTNIQASTILSENTNINTKGELNLLTKDEISINNMSGTEIEAKLSAKLDLSGVKETVKSVVDVVKGIPELPKAVNAAADLASGKDINESLEGNEEGIEQVSRMMNGPKSGE
ncbi:MAG: hypothetical protein SOY60_06690 [Fusobacterium gastrosuis]|uniref:hypothetical protein n=1 Tax=Fusobacterium gastrosuis TaxID=1755100 RepID=UPI002A8BD0AC|nr:hypothetical protein [Fusobacterium gastrosuis]